MDFLESNRVALVQDQNDIYKNIKKEEINTFITNELGITDDTESLPFKTIYHSICIKKRALILKELAKLYKTARYIHSVSFVHFVCGFNTILPKEINAEISSFLPPVKLKISNLKL